MSYTHFTSFERGQIQALLREGKGVNEIGRLLQRHPSSISREIRRNNLRGVYVAECAHQRYRERRKECRPARKLDHRPLWDYVLQKLALYWSPEAIAGRLGLDYPDDTHMRISHEALYQALYNDERLFPFISCLRQARPRRRKRGQGKAKRCLIPNRTSIHERPAEVKERSRFGDWEGDLVLGKNQQGAILSLVERKSLMLLARKVPSKHSDGVIAATVAALEDLPASWARTLTFDNGSEFYHHSYITEELGIPIYFADPYAAYQRGSNENTNGLIRQYLPKSISFENLSQSQLDVIVDEINNRPRKKLEFRSPNEVFQSNRKLTPVALSP
jgi:transposase, IS30 family